MSQTSKEINGLRVILDRLVYFRKFDKLETDIVHVFVYFITVSNFSQAAVTLKGRRWIIKYEDGHQTIIDGQGIVGKEPMIPSGESFSYNSYHTPYCNCIAHGSFHGTNASGEMIHVRIPEFQMNIPPDSYQSGPKEIKLF